MAVEGDAKNEAGAESERPAKRARFNWIGSESHGLDKPQVERYSRQLLVPAFGVAGQGTLCCASILVVGAGGLGSPVLLYLAAAGVGTLGIADDDVVEQSNLHRQVIHTEAAAEAGNPKTTSAKEACQRINSSIKVVEHRTRFTAANALDLVRPYDVIVDASDNVATRYVVNDACVVAGKPLVSGAALGMEGQLAVYHDRPGAPCYRCMFPVPPVGARRCADAGVLGVVPGIIGSLQALEAIKVATGIGEPLSARMLIFDALTTRLQTVKLRGRSATCAACGDQPTITAETLPSFDYAHFVSADTDPSPLPVLSAAESVSCAAYKARVVDAGRPHVVVDVREAHQFAIAALPGAISIPLKHLVNRIADVQAAVAEAAARCPAESAAPDVYVVCRRGNDSKIGTRLLRQKGIGNAFNLTGGVVAWADEIDPSFPTY
ncbi:adenylyltransferase and sulfurtransferase [Klebsormidium nitens]|uniref:Adenylyltransferase and sulfurtransferase MOCS3 n=1 Tax=Klebsormidium nitens TaxID=105231 RepID=A0A1Y1IAG8_KLENI|nr:adenylyltransferase and sulfurtransferase [Klebsormidium nitens]|eukprot:GAQ86121.1 adenylyltransferase and sulfurtransferase [Klebsormidium nitens]